MIFKSGTSVQTTEMDLSAKGYQPSARVHCRWGVSGVVVGYSDSHGLSYEVKHEDGTTAWYEPTEILRVIS